MVEPGVRVGSDLRVRSAGRFRDVDRPPWGRRKVRPCGPSEAVECAPTSTLERGATAQADLQGSEPASGAMSSPFGGLQRVPSHTNVGGRPQLLGVNRFPRSFVGCCLYMCMGTRTDAKSGGRQSKQASAKACTSIRAHVSPKGKGRINQEGQERGERTKDRGSDKEDGRRDRRRDLRGAGTGKTLLVNASMLGSNRSEAEAPLKQRTLRSSQQPPGVASSSGRVRPDRVAPHAVNPSLKLRATGTACGPCPNPGRLCQLILERPSPRTSAPLGPIPVHNRPLDAQASAQGYERTQETLQSARNTTSGRSSSNLLFHCDGPPQGVEAIKTEVDAAIPRAASGLFLTPLGAEAWALMLARTGEEALPYARASCPTTLNFSELIPVTWTRLPPRWGDSFQRRRIRASTSRQMCVELAPRRIELASN